MLTIKAEIKRSELKVDGTYNVKIRFTLDRKVKRLSTNLFVTQQDLTKSLKFKEDTSIKREVDRLVLYYREQCLKLQLDQNHYSLDEIVEFLNGEQEKQQTINWFFVKFGGNLFFISMVFLFFFLNPIKSCRYVCFLVTLKTPHH